MNKMIENVIEKLKVDLEAFFQGTETALDVAESFFSRKISTAITDLVAAYYEKVDADLLADKKGRKEAGLVVERRRCRREILTELGMVKYHRTYYKRTADGCYIYPVDAVAGIEAYQRLSNHISQDLVEAARTMSYEKSSLTVSGGQVSRRTVCNKVRQATPITPIVARKHVAVLHIDADEDHVKLQSGRGTIVPLISVYEGIDHHGKRGVCRNIWHKASFGQTSDELWEDTLDELERRYDLAGTKIYLHGDGAAWIKKGLEWLPNSVFVLDRFHKNKALKQAVSGIDPSVGKKYERVLRLALKENDKDLFQQATESLISQFPDRVKTICDNTNYILNNYEAIQICNIDPEALRGGCTEPHVSHVLSARLSSRPMAWSKTTLKQFVPLLAVGPGYVKIDSSKSTPVMDIVESKVQKTPRKKYSLGLTDPRYAIKMPGRTGRVTPLYNALRRF